LTNFVVATNEYRGGGAGERTEYHTCVAWDRLAEVCGQFLSKGQLVDIEGRLQTRQWDDAGVRHWKTDRKRPVIG
jgi:single-strand DNA-binding protein